jgi:hypothetical protein
VNRASLNGVMFGRLFRPVHGPIGFSTGEPAEFEL